MKNWSQKQTEYAAITVRRDYRSMKGRKNPAKKWEIELVLKGVKKIVNISSFHKDRCQQLGF